MSYSDFTLEAAEREFGVMAQEADLFPCLGAAPVPDWLPASLARGKGFALISEKARSEFIVVPILLAARQLCHDRFTIYSGQRLDVAPDRGLAGECDFILAAAPPVPLLRAPLITIVEAKKNDIEAGLGQCAAQMIAARLFNEQAGKPLRHVFGCVTTGEAWQFLRLEPAALSIDQTRYYIDRIDKILAVFQAIVDEAQPEPGP